MVNKELVKFIKEARVRGFDDYEIRKPLLEGGWPEREVERAFASLKEPLRFKNKVSVYLDDTVLKVIEKRAKRNLLSVSEQIEDIVRRSAVNQKRVSADEKLDDMLVALFSRKRRK